MLWSQTSFNKIIYGQQKNKKINMNFGVEARGLKVYLFLKKNLVFEIFSFP